MQVWNVLHAARWWHRTQKIAICAPLHNLAGYVFATKACAPANIQRVSRLGFVTALLTTARAIEFWIRWWRVIWVLGDCSTENCSNRVCSGRWRWQWYRVLWSRGKGGKSEVDEYEYSPGFGVRWDTVWEGEVFMMKPRFSAEWLVLS